MSNQREARTEIFTVAGENVPLAARQIRVAQIVRTLFVSDGEAVMATRSCRVG